VHEVEPGRTVRRTREGTYVLVARMWVEHREAMQVHFDLNRAITEEFQRLKLGETKAAD